MSTLRFFLGITLAALVGVNRAVADCGCAGPDDHVTVGYKQFAHFAGKITVKYYLAGASTAFAVRTYTAGTVGFDGSRYFASSYGCGETSDTLMIPAGIGQVVTIDTSFNNDPSSPDYTEVDPSNPAVLDYVSLPSASCLQHFYDANGDGVFLRIIPGVEVLSGNQYTNHAISHFVTYSSSSDESGAGSCDGPGFGLIQPHPDNPTFNDATPLGTLCVSGASAPTTTTQTASRALRAASSTSARGSAPIAKQPAAASNHRLVAVTHSTFPTNRRLVPDPFATGGANIKSPAQRIGLNRASAARGGVARDPGFELPTDSWHGPAQTGKPKFAIPGGGNTATSDSSSQTAAGDVAAAPGATSMNFATVKAGGRATTRAALSSTTPGSVVISDIGALNLPIALGYRQGQLRYMAPAIDASAYSPARLQLSADSATTAVITDPNSGALRQISLAQTFVDIRTLSAVAFEVRFYLPSQIGSFDGTLYAITDDTPFCIWRIENPDGTAAGRIKFSQTRGTQVLTHMAVWQPASATDAGTMTIARNNEAEIETRTYFLYSSAAYRGERVQRRAGPLASPGPVVADSFDVYQEYYNWSSTGQIFEILSEHIDDPDGAYLDTQYYYYDIAGIAPAALNVVIYPDGYWERYGRFSDGTLAKLYRPFKDTPASPGAASDSNCLVLTVTKNDAPDGLSETEIDQETFLNQVITRHDEIYKQVGNAYFETTLSYLANDATAYTQSQTASSSLNGQLLQAYDTNGLFRNINYVRGYWLPSSQTFSQTDISGIPVWEAIETQGSVTHQSGVANQSLIVVTVRDQADRVWLEETYVNNGSPYAPGSRSDWISRRVYNYDSRGLPLSQTLNGNVVFEAGYDDDGRVSYNVDETGIRTEYTYDAFGRVAQTVRKRCSSSPDQTTMFTYDAAGHLRFQTVSAAGLTSTTEYRYDLAGRQAEVITPDGLSQKTSEMFYVDSNGNPAHREVTVTSPSGATTVTEFYRDRQLFYKHGTAVPTEYWGYSYFSSPYGFKGSYFYRQLSDQPKTMYFQVTDWKGNTTQETTRNVGAAAQVDKIYTYNGGPNADGSMRGLLETVSMTGQQAARYEYDEFGQRSAEGVDLNGNGVLDRASVEPITTHTTGYENSGSPAAWYHVTRDYRELTNGVDAPVLQTELKEQLTGLTGGVFVDRTTLDQAGRRQRQTITVDRPNVTRTTVTRDLSADLSSQPQTQTEIGGLTRTLRRPEATADVTYTYDGLDRVTGISDPAVGNLTYAYNALGQLTTTTDSLNRSTALTYYPTGVAGAGQVATQQDPAGKVTHFGYTVRNQLFRQWGANVYPTEYAYDDQSRLVGLSTYRTTDTSVDWTQSSWPSSLPVSPDKTTWNYEYWTGLLASKSYADSSSVSYTYDGSLRLASRKNARNQTTSYGYDVAGRLSLVTYPTPDTPNVTYGYDRANRLTSVTDGGGVRALTYTDFDQLQNEAYNSGLLNGVTIARTFDAQNRLTGVSAAAGATALNTTTCGYDTLSRLNALTNPLASGGTMTSSYTYQNGTNRIATLTSTQGSATVAVTTRTYDSLGRLTAITTANGAGQVLFSHSYTQFDTLDHRKKAVREDGKEWNYDYDARGQVTGARKAFPASEGGQLLAGWQSAYAYDTIGNRVTADTGGDPSGQNLREATYTTNSLNQYTQRTTPGSFFITGDAAPNATVDVTVNEQPVSSVVREGASGAQSYYAAEFQGDNTLQGIYGVSRVRATVAGNAPTGRVDWFYLSKNPEAFTYDADGNLTSDDRWNYTWDAENRLISVETRSDRLRPVGPLPYERRLKLDFVYDAQGRRVQKKTSTWDLVNNTWVLTSDVRFVYDDWNCLADLQGAALALQCSYVWGLDLSGSVHGAGGVGGLLAQTTTTSGVAGDYVYAYDGNGNVTGLLDSSGAIAAEYDYGAFGGLLKSIGRMADVNVYRFSTKPQGGNGLYYYGYRYYSAVCGKWLSRDPIEERDQTNLYAFVGNCPTMVFDLLGLERKQPFDWHHNYPRKFRDFFESKGIDIDDSKNGVVMLQGDHLAFKQEFQEAWREFIESPEGKAACKADVEKYFRQKIRPRFGSSYKKSVPAKFSHPEWLAKAPEERLQIGSTGLRKVLAGVAIIGIVADTASAAEWMNKEDVARKISDLADIMSQPDDFSRQVDATAWYRQNLPGLADPAGSFSLKFGARAADNPWPPDFVASLKASFQDETDDN